MIMATTTHKIKGCSDKSAAIAIVQGFIGQLKGSLLAFFSMPCRSSPTLELHRQALCWHCSLCCGSLHEHEKEVRNLFQPLDRRFEIIGILPKNCLARYCLYILALFLCEFCLDSLAAPCRSMNKQKYKGLMCR